MSQPQPQKICLITGANAGIGFETAKAIAAAGHLVVMACRSSARAEQARDDILRTQPEASIGLLSLDLSSLDSVRGAAKDFAARYPRLDILINNAGVLSSTFKPSTEGYELMFATNHLGHFLLTNLLIPSLAEAEAARVVTLGSLMHKSARFNFDSLGEKVGERAGHNADDLYGQTKLAGMSFAYELQRRLQQAGSSVSSVLAHPGWTDSNIMHEKWLMNLMTGLLAQSCERGALPITHAALDDDVKGGEYYGPCGLAELKGLPTQVESSALAKDGFAAKEIWALSERLTAETFDV